MKILKWLLNRKNYSSIKEINIKTILNYLSAQFNSVFIRKHITEQVEERKKQVQLKSPECLLKNECLCGCTMSEKLFQKDECGEAPNCFPKMMSKKEWNANK